MTSMDFTDQEVALLHNAVSAFLGDFGHDEQDVVDQLKSLLVKLSSREPLGR
jgi:hypothetical protein